MPHSPGMTHNHSPSPALDERDAATYIGYTTSALRAWRRQGRGPAYIKAGRSVRYLVRDLDAWLAAHRVATQEVQ
jgi:predicted DNA-binding transcriptional regulator AlpA